MKVVEVRNRCITHPGQLGSPFNGDDGIGLAESKMLFVKDCIVDFSAVPLDEQDEACATTRGCSASFVRCIIRGAGKLFLIGGGDKEWKPIEQDSSVVLRDCILEDFGRRGPEVQCGMACHMERCLVQYWADPDRFTVRSFAAWAHDDGEIDALDCLFRSRGVESVPWRQRVADLLNHIGQAVNDEGPKAIFSSKTYIPGYQRALVATAGGSVVARHCWFGPDTYTDSDTDPMTDDEAADMMAYFGKLREKIHAETRCGV